MKKKLLLSLITLFSICSYAQEENNIYKDCITLEKDQSVEEITYIIDLNKEFSSISEKSEVYKKLTNAFTNSEFEFVKDDNQFIIELDIPNKDKKHDAYLILRNYHLTRTK